MSKIEWTDITINPVVGCSPKSDGCKNCYAAKMFYRLKAMGTRIYINMEDFSDVAWNTKILLDALQKLKKPKRIFLCSMSDLFHEKVPDEVINNIIAMCGQFPQHTFMILTKRYERLMNLLSIKQPLNIQFGVSICNNEDLNKVYQYANMWSKVFVSFEPLLEKLDIKLLEKLAEVDWFNWFIVGSETGLGHRKFEEQWGIDILNVARKHDIPFFFKKRYLSNGSKTDIIGGVKIQEFPKDD